MSSRNGIAGRHRGRIWTALALAATMTVAACGDDSSNDEPTPKSLTIEKIGGYDGGAAGAAEITGFDPGSKRLFVVNGANGTLDVLDLAHPAAPAKITTISVAALGDGVNSVAVHEGLVAVAVQANPKTSPGKVAFYRASDLVMLAEVTVGALPDMVAFTPDGTRVLVANEGEPNSYGQPDSVDPEGSISVITIGRSANTIAPTVASADFRAFNGQEAALRAQGVRIYGPGASAAQDLEPEYITISEDGRTAWVTLQENNAIAVVDVMQAKVTAIKPLGLKDHSLAGAGLDPSDEDGGTDTNSGAAAAKIGNHPVLGMYLPDAIASFARDGRTWLITANEGDARADWPGFNEEVRVRAHCAAGLDPAIFGADAARLLFDSNLGRLRITSAPNGDDDGKNSSGQCTKLLAYGARSFTIWSSDVVRIYDSGDELEQRTLVLPNVAFNASNDNNTLDGRSASKGPEPEGVVVGRFGDAFFAFVGLERVGGVMVYDVTTPSAAKFVTYLNTRDGATGDRGPEGLTLIAADRSPNGKPLLVVGNETSGTVAIFQVGLVY